MALLEPTVIKVEGVVNNVNGDLAFYVTSELQSGVSVTVRLLTQHNRELQEYIEKCSKEVLSEKLNLFSV